jgi:hypothetical protein
MNSTRKSKLNLPLQLECTLPTQPTARSLVPRLVSHILGIRHHPADYICESRKAHSNFILLIYALQAARLVAALRVSLENAPNREENRITIYFSAKAGHLLQGTNKIKCLLCFVLMQPTKVQNSMRN